MKITRESYLAQFPPKKRNGPAYEWDASHAAAISGLSPTHDVIMLGARVIAGYRAECDNCDNNQAGSVVRVIAEDIAEAEAAIARHRAFYDGSDHLDVDAALKINFIR